jgi:hypothetical protein
MAAEVTRELNPALNTSDLARPYKGEGYSALLSCSSFFCQTSA